VRRATAALAVALTLAFEALAPRRALAAFARRLRTPLLRRQRGRPLRRGWVTRRQRWSLQRAVRFAIAVPAAAAAPAPAAALAVGSGRGRIARLASRRIVVLAVPADAVAPVARGRRSCRRDRRLVRRFTASAVRFDAKRLASMRAGREVRLQGIVHGAEHDPVPNAPRQGLSAHFPSPRAPD